MRKFFKNLIKHPKTSAAGIALVLTGAGSLARDPLSLLTGTFDVVVVPFVAILSGIGLLMGADSQENG